MGVSPFIGEIALVPYNFAPRGWAFCQGQILAISQNEALFSLLGTTYGGNGVTTYALPDLRGRVAVSSGQGPGLSSYTLGEVTGTEAVTLITSQIPSHSHTAAATQAAATSSRPANNVPSAGGAYNTTSDGSTMASGFIGSTGGSQPHSNVQPLLTLNYIIALEGIFPSRN